MEEKKPIHVKPSFYTYCFESLKIIAKEFGYNLVLHGSMSRDMDLIAIPWEEEVGDVDKMIQIFADLLGGAILDKGKGHEVFVKQNKKPHGRTVYIINLNRGAFKSNDPQYYLDISVMPTQTNENKSAEIK